MPKVLDYLLRYILAFYPLWSKHLQCMLLPDSDNPLTNFAVELRIRLVKVETMGKMAYQQAPRVVKKLVHDAEDRIIELNYDTNIWKGTRKRKQNQVEDERPAKNRAREMWKRTVAKLKMAGGIHSRKEPTDYGQKLLEKVLEIPIPGQVEDIDLEVNTSEVDALMTYIDFMSLPKTLSTYPQTSVEDGYADHSQNLVEKQLEVPIPSQVENIDLEVNAPEVDTLLTELMSLPELLSTYPHWQVSIEDGYVERDVSGQVIQCLESYLQEGNLKILN